MELRYRKLQGQSGHEAGRQLLVEMYRQRTGQALPAILIAPRGKPYFAEGNLHFSISHTKSYVFCALSENPIGIDAEEQNRDIKLSLAKKILSPCEYAQYEKAEDKKRALLTFWVLKEAQGKKSGVGINGFPNHTNFDLSDPRVQTIENHIVATIE